MSWSIRQRRRIACRPLQPAGVDLNVISPRRSAAAAAAQLDLSISTAGRAFQKPRVFYIPLQHLTNACHFGVRVVVGHAAGGDHVADQRRRGLPLADNTVWSIGVDEPPRHVAWPPAC